jgi:hypothetical protein
MQPDDTPPNPYSAPQRADSQPMGPPTAFPVNQGDGTGGLIPYKNPKALIAYYLGILSGLPLIGLPLGIAAFVLGILGLRDRRRNPIIKGSIHAGIGIGCGGFFALFWGTTIVGIIIALILRP